MKWLILFVLIPLWFLQNVIHETAHGLVVKIFKWDFIIYPYPNTKLGRFTFASVLFIQPPNSQNLTAGQIAWVYGMPKLVNLVFIAVLNSILFLAPLNFYVFTVLSAFLLTNLVDFQSGFFSLLRNVLEADWTRLQFNWDINRRKIFIPVLIVIITLLFGVSLTNIIYYYQRIFI